MNLVTGGLVLTTSARLLCGGVAGAIAQSFSYPLDVTRRRMQLAMMNHATHKYRYIYLEIYNMNKEHVNSVKWIIITYFFFFSTSMLQTMKMIYKENGIAKGLYRGMSINYLRAIPMVSVSFTTYEIMKQVLNLDTGIKL